MTALQGLFLAGLTGVLVAVVGFAAVVVRSAARTGGGPHITAGFVRHFARPGRERAEVHRWAFYLHRISGFAIFAFLCLHIVDVSTYALSPARYDELHMLYGTAPMRVFEAGLLVAILFHTLNGLRLVAVDVVDLGIDASRRALMVVAALTALLGAAGGAVIVAPVFA